MGVVVVLRLLAVCVVGLWALRLAGSARGLRVVVGLRRPVLVSLLGFQKRAEGSFEMLLTLISSSTRP